MSITFAVDPVPPSTTPAPTRPLRDQVGPVLALGGDPDLPVIDAGGVHPLLAAVHLAFSEHRPLVLSPDDVWLTLAQGFAQHVRLNATRLRPRLVPHDGRRVLTVTWDGPLPHGGPGWSTAIGRLREALAAEIRPGRQRLLTCDFSTTGDLERTASEIILLEAFSPYYDYHLYCVCGIPEVTLVGTPADWHAIRARLDVLAEFDLEWWTRSLVPICDQFVRTAEGAPDVGFWQEIYKPQAAYGWDRVTGWIARLYPYIGSDGKYTTPNPLLAVPHAELMTRPAPRDASFWAHAEGIRTQDVPAGLSRALLRVQQADTERDVDVDLEGGLLAVVQDEAGRIRAQAGFLVRAGQASIYRVIERLRAEHKTSPCTGVLTERQVHAACGSDSELHRLYDEVAQATLFAGPGEWRLRPVEEVHAVSFALPRGQTEEVRWIIDLPDGTSLGHGESHKGRFLVRFGRSGLGPPEPSEFVMPWQSPELPDQVPVVGTSIAAVLEGAMRSGGSLDLPAQGTLLDQIDEWRLRPPPSPPPDARPRRRTRS